MSILDLLIYPNKNLRKKTKKVKIFNKKIKKKIENMFNTMYFYNGIGLAATQVNINKSIIVIDITKKKNKKIVLINPHIIKKNGYLITKEGCLSIPKIFISIKRYKNISVNAKDQKGKSFKINAKGLLSVCIQHEIDHLNGKLFIDYLNNNNKIK